MKTLQLKGIETLVDDLNMVLQNDYCEEVDISRIGKAAKYEYRYHCGKIYFQVESIGESYMNGHIKEEIEEAPAWYLELNRVAKLIWNECMRKSLAKLEKTGDPRLDKFTMTNRMYQEQEETKKVVMFVFEQHNWVIPHYVYWNAPESIENEFYAVMSMGGGKPVLIQLSGKLKEDLFNEIKKRNFSLRKHLLLPLNLDTLTY